MAKPKNGKLIGAFKCIRTYNVHLTVNETYDIYERYDSITKKTSYHINLKGSIYKDLVSVKMDWINSNFINISKHREEQIQKIIKD